MSRLPALTPDQLTPEQKRLHDAIAGPRGGSVGGPFAVWLRVPRIAEAANRMGNSLRLEGKLDRRLFELAILAIARHWSAQYEWFVHDRRALRCGTEPRGGQAAAHRKAPGFARERRAARLRRRQRAAGDAHAPPGELPARARGARARLLIELVSVDRLLYDRRDDGRRVDAPVPGGARPLP